MKASRKVRSQLSLALLIAASSAAIACYSTRGWQIPGETVQLRQIRVAEQRLDVLIDNSIRAQLSGGRGGLSYEGDESLGGPRAEEGPKLFDNIIRGPRLTDKDIPVNDLQQLRNLIHLRVDEAYAAKGDLSRFTDLTSLRVGADAVACSINRPALVSVQAKVQ